MSAAPTARSRTRGLRVAAAAGGLFAVAWLLGSAGPAEVFAVLGAAARWVPLLGACEVALVATDTLAARALLRPASAPLALWARAGGRAYAASTLLPAGRAVGEALRAHVLQPVVGLRAATSLAVRLQALSLYANATVSVLALVVLHSRARGLAFALGANAAACFALGSALYGARAWSSPERSAAWAARSPRLAALLHLDAATSSLPAASAAATLRALGWLVFGRCAQTLQYGFALAAVGGAVTLASSLAAQGIHLVGAAAGDFIPGQLGANEGSYRIFAGALGLDDDVGRALALPLLMRGVQLMLALLGLLLGTRAPR